MVTSVAPAKTLNLDVADLEMFGDGAQFCRVGLARLGAQLDQGAAGKIDAEIHPHIEEKHDRNDRKERRERDNSRGGTA